ncbi:MAG: hypothetical protein KAI59_05825 [Planctomycetes bacterium]|nr:hypothetical protein [Planctomycetota bacterium]
MNNKEENIKDLFGKFFGSEEIEKAMKDFQKADEILAQNPSPQPDEILITKIKAQMNHALLQRKTNTFRKMAYKMAAVAAVIIIAATVSIKTFENYNTKPQQTAYSINTQENIWEDENANPQTLTLAEEIKQVEQDMIALRLDENNGNGEIITTQLEMELVEIESDFWKG